MVRTGKGGQIFSTDNKKQSQSQILAIKDDSGNILFSTIL